MGIFTDPWMGDFYGKLVGKYTYTSPMDAMGYFCNLHESNS